MDLEVVFDPTTSSTASTFTLPSSASCNSSTVDAPDPPVDISSTALLSKPPKRRPIPRKGHTKSRNGCLNCKRRKVKCQETLPECGHCIRIGLRCQYPADNPHQSHPTTTTTTLICLSSSSSQRYGSSPAPPSPGAVISPSPPSSFSLDDMRFLQHFLLKAYPPLPIHGDGIWQGEVAQIAHGFGYLLHAMLGLAASSLSLLLSASPSSSSSASIIQASLKTNTTPYTAPSTPISNPSLYRRPALSHRTHSIHLLNASLSSPCTSREEGTARYATMMALTFQSSYMADGMLDFVAMTRGCHVIAHTAMLEGEGFEKGPFGVFSREGHVDACRRLGGVGKADGGNWDGTGDAEGKLGEELLDGLLRALTELEELCAGKKLETEVLRRVKDVVTRARWDCIEAFNEITRIYALLGSETTTHEDFFVFVSPDNWPAQILLVYFFLVEYTVAYHAMGFIRSSFAYRRATTKLWVEHLVGRLPEGEEEYGRYMEWPVWFVDTGLDLFEI